MTQETIAEAARGSALLLLGRMFEYSGRFLFMLLLAHFVAAEQYGIYVLGTTILGILLGIILLGLDVGVVYYIPRLVNRGAEDSLRGLVFLALGVPLLLGILTGTGLVYFGSDLKDFFDEPGLLLLIPLMAIALPLNAVLAMATQATIGFKRIRYKVIAQDVVLTAVKLSLLALSVLLGITVVGAMAIHTVGTAVAGIFALYFLHKLLPLNCRDAIRFEPKQVFGFSIPVYLSRLAAMMEGNVQIILIGILAGSASVGIFGVSLQLSMLGIMLYDAVVISVEPHISDLSSKGRLAELRPLHQMATKWSFVFGLAVFLVILLFSRDILIIVGESFASGEHVLLLLAFANLIRSMTVVSTPMITMTGRPWLNTANSTLALLCSLGLGLWLIPLMGLVGAGISVAGSVFLVSVVRTVEVYFLFNLLPWNRTFLKPVAAALFSLGLTHILQISVLPASLPGVLLGISILLLSYAAILVLLGLDEHDLMILQQLRSRMKYWRQEDSGREH